MSDKHTEFLQILIREGKQDKLIANKFRIKSLIDANYHDGMSDRAIALSIKFQEMFAEELS